MPNLIRLGVLVLSTVVMVGSVSACSTEGAEADYALSTLSRQASTNNAIKLFEPRSLSEALPTVSYRLPSGEQIHLSSIVVRGKFVRWERGKAVNWSAREDDSPSGKSVSWEDPTAQTRTILVEFVVDELLASARGVAGPARGASVEVQVYVNGDSSPERVGDGLVDAGAALLFLTSTPASTGGKWVISQDGGLIATVSAAGDLRLATSTALDGSERPSLKDDLKTISAVRARAKEDRLIAVGE